MDTLTSVLRPAAKVLNRNIQESTPARELCESLADAVIAVRVRESALAAYFLIHDDMLELHSRCDQDPDVIVSGSIIALTRMLSDSTSPLPRDGSVTLTGDAETAQRFQKLLMLAKPELEEELANIVGDIAAHRLGNMARGLARWSRDARATMGMNISEYLQEESRETPSRFEADEFFENVGILRDDVERVEARLNRLRQNDTDAE